MYNILKNISDTNNWKFTYAKKEFSNLYDGEEEVGNNTPLIFLDPVQITENSDEFNYTESTIYQGSFMVLLSSDIDEENYEFRYQNYIKPTVNSTVKTIKNAIACDGNYTIQNWRMVEVINAFDFNADGIIITYNIKE